jgi:hypothetical protein
MTDGQSASLSWNKAPAPMFRLVSYLLQPDGLGDTFVKGLRCSGNCSSSGLHSHGNVCQCMRCRVYNFRLGNNVFIVPCMGNIVTEPLSSNGLRCCVFLTALSQKLILTSRCLAMDAHSDILPFRRHATISLDGS